MVNVFEINKVKRFAIVMKDDREKIVHVHQMVVALVFYQTIDRFVSVERITSVLDVLLIIQFVTIVAIMVVIYRILINCS